MRMILRREEEGSEGMDEERNGGRMRNCSKYEKREGKGYGCYYGEKREVEEWMKRRNAGRRINCSRGNII